MPNLNEFINKPEAIKEEKTAAAEQTELIKGKGNEKSDSNDPKDPVKVIGKIDLDSLNQKTRPNKKTRKQREEEFRNSKKDSKKGCDGRSVKCITHYLWDDLEKHIVAQFQELLIDNKKVLVLAKKNENIFSCTGNVARPAFCCDGRALGC